MTIPRRPVTFERALAQIADLLGWDGCAEVLGKSESHVRKLGAPDTEREISLRDAVRLDDAWQRAGGEGAPLIECYALKLGMGALVFPANTNRILARAERAAKENGEAVAAAISLATRTGDPAARLNAIREIEEAIQESTRLLAGIMAMEHKGESA